MNNFDLKTYFILENHSVPVYALSIPFLPPKKNETKLDLLLIVSAVAEEGNELRKSHTEVLSETTLGTSNKFANSQHKSSSAE